MNLKSQKLVNNTRIVINIKEKEKMTFDDIKQLASNGRSDRTSFDDPKQVLDTVKLYVDELNKTRFDSPQQKKRAKRRTAKVLRFLLRVPSLKSQRNDLNTLVQSVK